MDSQVKYLNSKITYIENIKKMLNQFTNEHGLRIEKFKFIDEPRFNLEDIEIVLRSNKKKSKILEKLKNILQVYSDSINEIRHDISKIYFDEIKNNNEYFYYLFISEIGIDWEKFN